MTQKEKDLLLKDLCARLPYGVYCTWFTGCIDTLNRVDYTGELVDVCKVTRTDGYVYWDCYFDNNDNDEYENSEIPIEIVKPYLRPMSSMTEEEKEEYQAFFNYDGVEYPEEYIDWLNKKMFDYHKDNDGKTMIEKGLALKAPEDMYK